MNWQKLGCGWRDHISIPGRAKQSFPTDFGAHTTSNAMNNIALSPGLRQLSREADHLDSEAKNMWNYTSISPQALRTSAETPWQ
jgi:hypothetical protein